MNLLDLPNEILSSLPLYIDDIETFTSVASSCRRLRENFARTHPKTILLLADASTPTFFSPHPYFLITGMARQVSSWALENKENAAHLRKVFQKGIYGLYDFCIDNPNIGLTMEDIRRLYEARFSTINPLVNQIDGMAGKQWQSVDNFWVDGVSEAETLETESDLAAFHIIIYGELFASSMQAFLESERELLPSFDEETRKDYIKYCIVDHEALRRQSYVYPREEDLTTWPRRGSWPDPQLSFRHVLQCRRWRRKWAQVIRMIDRNFGEAEFEEEEDGDVDRYYDESWSHRLYRNALQTQGLEGMQLLILPKERISQEGRDQALKIKRQVERQVERLQGQFDDVYKLKASLRDAPSPDEEVRTCLTHRFSSFPW